MAPRMKCRLSSKMPKQNLPCIAQRRSQPAWVWQLTTHWQRSPPWASRPSSYRNSVSVILSTAPWAPPTVPVSYPEAHLIQMGEKRSKSKRRKRQKPLMS